FFISLTSYHHRVLPSFPTRRSSDLGVVVVPADNVTRQRFEAVAGQCAAIAAQTSRAGGNGPSTHVRNPAATLLDQVLGGDGANLDRKSTRLNSSHGSISYAVFCLKK